MNACPWFYLARIPKTDVRPAGLQADEADSVLGYQWFLPGGRQARWVSPLLAVI